MLVEVAKVGDIASGGMQLVMVDRRQVALCNCDGAYFAVARQCGHMNGPLERGALDGTILTCPLHHVQYDVARGEALNYPMTAQGTISQHDEVCDIQTYEVRIEGDRIFVGTGAAASAET